ncbi:hypothetical protein BON67_01645 [Escherichia coli]|uniref:Uncharacterized protein n=1 Tax=Escherichia coli TaxID=562 RepID=A0A1Q6AEM0_ECOLX|nr:hypothetical protein BE957_03790 [Escherichia coli]AQW75370.1 hypothetical protein B2H83_22615 [Escherichia coli M8]EFK01707.1 hypothetical protein HMPREF9548_03564 [Escherichia coli MS 182-1]EFK66233.1 hypothetical protein HMPREF9347_04907 [Escherichia coli MS 124-1]EGB87618.1 hypothetical protein HMPREF9542_02935 [Escherichia coli MS 117-3]ESD70324.1 hypothetical protein HMPREF1609_03724 [Escherichia coli 908541]KDV58972.1 hypothetical protein BU54_13820 [Escherichia coli O45:H2 str. 201
MVSPSPLWGEGYSSHVIPPGNIYCRFCLHILPLNNSPFLAYIWLTFINVIDSSPAFMGMRSDLF